MFGLFQSKPLISEESAQWLLAAFDWALSHYDRQAFFQHTQLVQPNNEFFPGRVDSVHAKAENIFNHCLRYTGLQDWPFTLQPPELYNGASPSYLALPHIERYQALPSANLPAQPLQLSYNPQQTLKAEDMAANFAHLLAQHLVVQSRQLPPGGEEYLMEATEVLGISMGFGVLFANSAYTFRGGCGSCYNAMANRQASLTEHEVIFALALFCQLKGIETKQAISHLKPHLKKAYRQAQKQLQGYSTELGKLQQLAA